MKLSRKTLEAALARFRSGWWDREHEETIEAACDALLAVMEPASDEEADAAVTIEVRDGRHVLHHPLSSYRAAEARARRVAEWEIE